MIQSRFFHSSIKEIELNVKEIYSLQSELRKRVLATTNKSAKIIPVQTTSFQGVKTYDSSSASSDSLSNNGASGFSIVEKSSNSAEQPKQQFIWNEEKFDQNDMRQISTSSLTKESEFKSNLNEVKKGIKSVKEPSKEHKKINHTLKVVLIFLIWEVSALMIFVFFIL